MVAELCGQRSPYQQERLNVVKQFWLSRRVKGGRGDRTLKELLSDTSFAVEPESPPDLEKLVYKLGIVIDADRLAAPVIDACWAWRGVCKKVLRRCRAVEAEGCYWLWKAAEEPPEDQPTVARLQAPQVGLRPRQAMLDAIDSLMAFDGESGRAVATKKSKGGAPRKWDRLVAFYEQKKIENPLITDAAIVVDYWRRNSRGPRPTVEALQNAKGYRKNGSKRTPRKKRSALTCENPRVKTKKSSATEKSSSDD